MSAGNDHDLKRLVTQSGVRRFQCPISGVWAGIDSSGADSVASTSYGNGTLPVDTSLFNALYQSVFATER